MIKASLILFVVASFLVAFCFAKSNDQVVGVVPCSVLSAHIQVGGLVVGDVQVLNDGSALLINSKLNDESSSVLAIKSYRVYAGLQPLSLNLLGIPLLGGFPLLGEVDGLLGALNLSPLLSSLGLTCGLNINVAVNLQLVHLVTGQILNAWAVNDLLSASISLGSPLCCP